MIDFTVKDEVLDREFTISIKIPYGDLQDMQPNVADTWKAMLSDAKKSRLPLNRIMALLFIFGNKHEGQNEKIDPRILKFLEKCDDGVRRATIKPIIVMKPQDYALVMDDLELHKNTVMKHCTEWGQYGTMLGLTFVIPRYFKGPALLDDASKYEALIAAMENMYEE